MEHGGSGEETLTLMQFLSNTFSESTTRVQLIVSGHSLGGNLSPVLALSIDQSQSMWNPSNTVIVSTMPTAGASPGNEAFSNFQNQIMGARTLRFWNKLDPVPHGWQPDLLEQVPFLYYPYVKPGILFKGLAALILAQSIEGTSRYPEGGFYTSLQPQAPPLAGQVSIGITSSPSAAEVLNLFIDMGAEKLLAKLGVGGIFRTLIIDALNWYLKEFDNEESLEVVMDKIAAKLNQIPGHSHIDILISDLKAILIQVENVGVYLEQLAFQHVTAYPYLMGTAALHPLSQAIVNNVVSSGSLDTDYRNLLDKLTDPKRQVNRMLGTLGDAFADMLTPEFIEKMRVISA